MAFARDNQQLLRLRNSAGERGECEQHEAGEIEIAMAVEIAEPAAETQDDQGEPALAVVEVGRHGWRRYHSETPPSVGNSRRPPGVRLRWLPALLAC